MSAHVQIPPILATRYVDKRRSTTAAGSTDDNIGTPANYASIDALETRLLALGYSQSDLNSMTVNDKQYALRLKDDSAGVN
jgi:hypothetical protein